MRSLQAWNDFESTKVCLCPMPRRDSPQREWWKMCFPLSWNASDNNHWTTKHYDQHHCHDARSHYDYDDIVYYHCHYNCNDATP